ncbi:MAG: phospholipase D-like domain-containing protein, partial [Caldimonas sp.]
ATIVGGRNIGDEYFGAGDGVLFTDLDVLAIGPIVPEVSIDFDRFWSSASSYPVSGLLPPVEITQREHFEAEVARIGNEPASKRYTDALRSSSFVAQMIGGTLELKHAPIRLVSDDPAKGLGHAKLDDMFPVRLKQALGDPKQQLLIVSPYFVPTRTGVDELVELASNGVDIRALTNSWQATDVGIVHAGYAKWRKRLLEAGIRLYEMRKESAGSPVPTARGITGSSAASLHAKTFAVDRARLFVGSFNFDPRSARLNTELGFVIQSAELTTQAANDFENRVSSIAYEVRLSVHGEMVWIEQQDGPSITHTTEPGTSSLDRLWIDFLSLLPIDWML